MKALLANLSQRDRRVIVLGAAAALILSLLFAWLSLNGRVQRLVYQVQWQTAAHGG